MANDEFADLFLCTLLTIVFFPFGLIFMCYRYMKLARKKVQDTVKLKDILKKEASKRIDDTGCCEMPSFRNVVPLVTSYRIAKKRRWLRRLLECCSCLLYNCICGCDFRRKISITDAINRYSEYMDMEEQKGEDVFKKLKDDKYLLTIVELFNYELPHFFLKVLPSGSLREGFGKSKPSSSILASDYDLMLVPDGVAVSEGYKRYSNSKAPIIFETVTNTNEIPPGFLWLKLVHEGLENWNSLCFQRLAADGVTVERYLSQLKLYELLAKTLGLEPNVDYVGSVDVGDDYKIQTAIERTGPAMNIKMAAVDKQKSKVRHMDEVFDADFTFALYCPSIPAVALEKLDQMKRAPWPGKQTIKRIREVGCHIVPKASEQKLTVVYREQPINSHLMSSSALEFRYSYSQAELLLSDVVPPAYKRCYRAFKALIKCHINNCPDKLNHESWGKFHSIPSYVLKTILFQMLTESGVRYNEDTMGACLLEMMKRLEGIIKQRSCPMFWNPEIDLIKSFDESDYSFIQWKVERMAAGEDALKFYLVDNWLEVQRCVRLNCCRCCMEDEIIGNRITPEKTPCSCQCCRFNCNYDNCHCCGPMSFNESAIGVY